MEKSNKQEQPLIITRVFDAPLELVWQAWSQPEQLRLWSSPNNYTIPFYHADVRVGGKYHMCMRSADGQNYYSAGTYKEIIPMKKIVWSDGFADENGNIISAEIYGMGDLPLEQEISVSFEEDNGKTKTTLEHSGIPQGDTFEQMRTGWNECFDKLEDSLKIKEGDKYGSL